MGHILKKEEEQVRQFSCGYVINHNEGEYENKKKNHIDTT